MLLSVLSLLVISLSVIKISLLADTIHLDGAQSTFALLLPVVMKALAHFFLPLSGFFGPFCCDCRGGGGGMTPACPKSRPTVSDGWAPTDIQYLQERPPIREVVIRQELQQARQQAGGCRLT